MAEYACPCCGGPMERPAPAHDLLKLRLPPKQRAVLETLVRYHPNPAHRETILDALYGLDPNGGPLWAEGLVNVYVCHLNKRIAAAGWHAGAERGTGFVGLTKINRQEGMAA